MQLSVLRYSVNEESTLGLLFIDGVFACYTLEDEPRKAKIKGETRIPEGTYKVELRIIGTHHQKYLKKYPYMHLGMLHITGVPNFTNILIHIGNTDDDTDGCLLVGDSAISNVKQVGRINSSTIAYEKIYPKIAARLHNGEDVYITYHDEYKLKHI